MSKYIRNFVVSVAIGAAADYLYNRYGASIVGKYV